VTNERQAEIQAAAERLTAKLQALYRTLPPDEQLVPFHLLKRFAGSASVEAGRLTTSFTLDLPDGTSQHRKTCTVPLAPRVATTAARYPPDGVGRAGGHDGGRIAARRRQRHPGF
jgi:hypothetical protein